MKYLIPILIVLCINPLFSQLTITHPNGGEQFERGDDVSVTWQGVNAEELIKLEYSPDNGATWQTISEEAGGLEYSWNTTGLKDSEQYLLRASTFGKPDADTTIKWAKSFGADSNDFVLDIKQTIDSNYVILIGTEFISPEIEMKGEIDIRFLVINLQGEILIDKVYGGKNDDIAYEVLPLENGEYIIVGCTSSTDGDFSDNHGGTDAFVMKLDNSGEKIWVEQYGGKGSDVACCLCNAGKYGLVVAGSSNSSDGDLTQNSGSYDLWAFCVDRDGNLRWSKSIGGSSFEDINSIKANETGQCFITGVTDSVDGPFESSNGGRECFFGRINAGGIFYLKTFGGSKNETGNDIILTQDGGYLVVGQTNSYDDGIAKYPYVDDYMLLKYDKSLNLEWSKAWGGSGSDKAESVLQKENGNFLIAGTSDSYDGNIINYYGMDDIWIIETDENGEFISGKTIGGSWNEWYPKLCNASDNNYLMTLKSTSNDNDIHSNPTIFDPIVICLGPGNSVAPQSDISDATFSIMAAHEPNYMLLQASLDLGEVVAGRDTIITAVVIQKNANNYNKLDTIYLEGQDVEFFELLSQTANVPVDDRYDIMLRFSPADTVAYSATVTFISEADTLQLPVTGKGKPDDISVDEEMTDGYYSSPNGAKLYPIAPNPARKIIQLIFTTAEPGPTEIAILNVLGQTFKSINIEPVSGKNSIDINISTFPSGQYFVQLRTATVVDTKKIIIK